MDFIYSWKDPQLSDGVRMTQIKKQKSHAVQHFVNKTLLFFPPQKPCEKKGKTRRKRKIIFILFALDEWVEGVNLWRSASKWISDVVQTIQL